MKTIEPIYNAGRWMVYCPVHGRDGAVLALDYHKEDEFQSRFWTVNNEYICPLCYKGITAEFLALKNGRLEKQPDRSARKTARLLAEKKDEVYTVVFPEHKDEIEAVLKDRPKLKQNWDGRHESVEFLERENHIMDNYSGRNKKRDAKRQVY